MHSLRELNFFRLLPKNARHRHGKWHLKVVSVKLSRPQNILRKKHVDCHFAMASVKHEKELSSLFSDENVFSFLRAIRQKCLLVFWCQKSKPRFWCTSSIQLKYPDRDFPVGEKHRLFPSVYAACGKSKYGSIGYNGRTYVAIWSEKHDKSSAASHIEDFWALLSLDEFGEVCLKDGA